MSKTDEEFREWIEGKLKVCHKFTANDELKRAAQEWIDNEPLAETKFGPISHWDVSEISSMKELFRGAASFNADLSRWVVDKVVDMSGMFANATSFDSDLSCWQVSQSADTTGMFDGASSLNVDSATRGWAKKPT